MTLLFFSISIIGCGKKTINPIEEIKPSVASCLISSYAESGEEYQSTLNYNNANQLIKEIYKADSYNGEATYTYSDNKITKSATEIHKDGNGNPISKAITEIFDLDSQGRIIKQYKEFGNDMYTFFYTYTPDGYLNTSVLKNGEKTIISTSYKYDNGNLVSLNTTGPESTNSTITYKYDISKPYLTTSVYKNPFEFIGFCGTKNFYGKISKSRIVEIKNTQLNGFTDIRHYTYTEDSDNNVVSVKEEVIQSDDMGAKGQNYTFAYKCN